MRLRLRCALLSATVIAVTIAPSIFLLSSSPLSDWQKNIRPRGGQQNGVRVVGYNRQDRYRSNSTKYNASLDLMPKQLRKLASGLPVAITAAEFRKRPGLKTGNPLIDTYGENDVLLSGEQGRGVTFVDKDKEAAAALQREFNVNVKASDVIPLNRMVPDSRLDG